MRTSQSITIMSNAHRTMGLSIPMIFRIIFQVCWCCFMPTMMLDQNMHRITRAVAIRNSVPNSSQFAMTRRLYAHGRYTQKRTMSKMIKSKADAMAYHERQNSVRRVHHIKQPPHAIIHSSHLHKVQTNRMKQFAGFTSVSRASETEDRHANSDGKYSSTTDQLRIR